MNSKTTIPKMYNQFDCEEYFISHQYSNEGIYDALENKFVILPQASLKIDPENNHLVIGEPAPGVEFCYRAGMCGIWSYYAVDDEYTEVAPDIKTLLDDWNNGKINI